MNTQQEAVNAINELLSSWHRTSNHQEQLQKIRDNLQSTHPIAADAEALAKEFAGTNYTKNHFPRRYQDRIDGFLAGFKAGYASQPKGAGVWMKANERLPDIKRHYNCKIGGLPFVFWIDKANNSIVNETGDLIHIEKWDQIYWLDESSSLPSQEGQ